MFNIGSQEFLFILLLVFLLFGPRHIPEVARTLGKGLGDFQRAMRGMEEGVRRAANEIPRVTEEDPVSPVPQVLPAAGSVERGKIPIAAEPPPAPGESSATTASASPEDAARPRRDAGA